MKTKEELIKDIKWSSISDRPKGAGGQYCGMPHYTICGELEELGIKIECKMLRSMVYNRELVKDLLELAIDEYLNQFK